MIYHKYGQTGIDVSAIGFGGMRFDDNDDIDTCAALVKAAYDKDINYFDTAPGYPRSEEVFGLAIKEMKKARAQKPFYVSTKTSKVEASEIRRDIETSLTKMNLDYIDFYHLWCILSFDAYRERKNKGALAEFERLKDEGLIRNICVSTHMTGPDVGLMLKDYPFEGVLLGYSAMNFAYRDAGLDAAARLNRAVVVMNPLGGGIIPQHPDRFTFVKTRLEETIVQAALRFLINDPRITISLVGFSNQKQLTEALSAVEGFEPIGPDAIRRIRNSLSRAFNELCTCCGYCDNCPQGIPIPKVMDTYNHYILTGDQLETINRLRWHWGIALEDNQLDKCTECGQCEDACTQKLPICERIKLLRAEVENFLEKEAAKKKSES